MLDPRTPYAVEADRTYQRGEWLFAEVARQRGAELAMRPPEEWELERYVPSSSIDSRTERLVIHGPTGGISVRPHPFVPDDAGYLVAGEFLVNPRRYARIVSDAMTYAEIGRGGSDELQLVQAELLTLANAGRLR